MGTLQISKVLIVLIFYTRLCLSLERRPVNSERNEKICMQQARQPYFDIELVTGKPWRIYYTWNVGMQNKCLDVTIKNATAMIANRIYNDMHEYLISQPEWDAATLHVSMGRASHELLMFADQGPAGRFLGVPNVIRDGNITPSRRAVPLLKFFLKLIQDGKYLLMMDCYIGVASLLSRKRPPYMADIASVAKSLNLGNGSHACLSEKRKGQLYAQQ